MDFIRKVGTKLYFVLLATAILMAVSAHSGKFFGYSFSQIFYKDDSAKAASVSLETAKGVFPNAAALKEVSSDEIQVYDVKLKELGWILQTMPSCSDLKGFKGQVPLLICLNSNKEVIRIIMLDNSETPSFAEQVKKNLLDKWNGKNASEAASIEVDAVTGATFTSKAVIESVRRRLASFEKITVSRRELEFKQLIAEIFAWAFLVVALLAYFFTSKLGKYRNYILVASVLIQGVWLGRFVSLETINGFGESGFPVSTQLFLIVVLFLALVLPMLSGKAFYCVWYCPFGALQELVGKVFNVKINITGKTGKFLKSLRPSLLIIVVFLLLIGIKVNLGYIEPFAAFKSYTAYIPMAISIVVLLFSFFVAKPWCNYFCPTGQFLECARYTPLKVEQKETNAKGDENAIKSVEIIKGEDGMKVSEVVNLLLVIAIIILLMGQQKPQLSGQRHEHNNGNQMAKMGENIPQKSQNADVKKESNTVVKDVNKLEQEQIMQAIFSRKSVRHYTDKPVEKEKLEMLVKAAMAAPTAMNRQPWQFVVLDDPEKVKELCDSLPYAKYNCTAAVVICGDTNIDTNGMFWVQDCSAATENLLLAAESMGLGAVWTAVTPDEGRISIVKENLGLPENVHPLNFICVGYPTGEDQPQDKWKPEKLHWGKY